MSGSAVEERMSCSTPRPAGCGDNSSRTAVPPDLDPISNLERGDWRTALRLLQQDDRYGGLLGADLRTISRAMAARAGGDHGVARETLAIASSSLHRRQPGLPVLRAKGGDVVQLALPQEPGPSTAAQAVFRTVRLICREQGELRLLRHQTGRHPAGLTEDRHILVLAFVEYLCWVELDPGTWAQKTPAEEAAPVERRIAEFVDRRRDALLRSATDMRRLHRPMAGGMTRAVWDRADQYRGLRWLALKELASRPPPPWTEPACSDRIPARIGARCVWEAARAV